MITLFSWPTPNGQKVQIMLEEAGLDYELKLVNILKGEQFDDAYVALNPNGKVPTILDPGANGAASISVFETGAILLYLAEKCGRFLPQEPSARTAALEWLFFQCSSLGPMLGQVTHFRRYAAQEVTYAIERYSKEAARLYAVLERRLTAKPWLAGDTYTIADMATFPWICRFRRQGLNIDAFPALKDWLARISERPAVQRAMALGKDAARASALDDQARQVLFHGGQPPAEMTR